MGPAIGTVASIRNLSPNGENWISWKAQIKAALGVNSLLPHIEGTAPRPAEPTVYPQDTVLSQAQLRIRDEEVGRVEKYKGREEAAKLQIFTSVSDSLMLKLQSLTTAKQVWDTVVAEYEAKPNIVKSDLQRRLRSLKAKEGDDIKAHLDSLQDMRQRLATMGMEITDDDFLNVILNSLPDSYDTMMSSITTSAEVAERPLTPSMLITIAKGEYDRRMTRTNGNGRDDNGTTEALASVAKGNRKNLICINPNCKRTGHLIADCWSRGGGKEGQGPRSKQGNNNRRDWRNQDSQSSTNVNSTEDAFAFVAASIAPIRDEISITVWDSGCNSHMSPYREQFETFEEINPPREVRAADNKIFLATGMGSMKIRIPNGKRISTITLQDVLYSPSLTFTLVSIARCDKKGYSCTFGDGSCIVRSPTGQTCGTVERINGLYQTGNRKDHVPGTVAAMVLTKPMEARPEEAKLTDDDESTSLPELAPISDDDMPEVQSDNSSGDSFGLHSTSGQTQGSEESINTALKILGFSISSSNPAVFYKTTGTKTIMATRHVDDIIFECPDVTEHETSTAVASNPSIKDELPTKGQASPTTDKTIEAPNVPHAEESFRPKNKFPYRYRRISQVINCAQTIHRGGIQRPTKGRIKVSNIKTPTMRRPPNALT